jgi:hypothetical protein
MVLLNFHQETWLILRSFQALHKVKWAQTKIITLHVSFVLRCFLILKNALSVKLPSAAIALKNGPERDDHAPLNAKRRGTQIYTGLSKT